MIIIPARLASTRFPKKVLADIDGTPMVVATAKRVKDIDRVVIATDSSEVLDIAKEYGFEAVLTREDHQSGTDRINEAASKLNLSDDEIVINLQGDEPFIEKEVVQALYNRCKNIKDEMMVSCYKEIESDLGDDPNLVKVVLNRYEEAIYFSRSKIPFARDAESKYFGHIGIYGFKRATLKEFCSLGHSPLEDIEKLEQLRAIYHGKKISMVRVESNSFGIDTIEDLNKALDIRKRGGKN
ncbi:MAG: 3-deoxy-manno-octulosonate cytidylyltransferase [Sulfurospirillum sp.]|nr:MAG: 3-deoxy-manno-octulosonate cytidylyltransferase [Sulfurospirillum sp.]